MTRHRLFRPAPGGCCSRPVTQAPRRRLEFEQLERRYLLASYFVAPTGSGANPGSEEAPFLTIQQGLNAARAAGDIVSVRAGTYRERIVFPASGSASGGPITLQAFAGEQPAIDVAGLAGATENAVTIRNVSFVKLVGFEIKGNTARDGGAGVFVSGGGAGIEIRNNRLHDLRGTNSMGIAVYGNSNTPLSQITIDGNEIYDAQPAPSEALTINGNVTNFIVSNNRVHDVNNIGIDLIGGERDVHPTLVARNGVVRGNVVYRARSSYGGGYAAGIYVDGGKNIVIENNVSYENDLGLEVGAEHRGFDATGITVRNNLIYRNDKAGLLFGGYAASAGRTRNSSFYNNTVVGNDTHRTGLGQLWIQYASANVVTNNIFVAAANKTLVYSEAGNSNNTLNYNLYYSASGNRDVQFTWNNRWYGTMSSYRSTTGQDRNSIFADPAFVARLAGDFRLLAGSPAVDRGTSTAGRFAPADFAGVTRPQGARPDLGAFESLPSATPLQQMGPPAAGPTYPGGQTGRKIEITPAKITSYQAAAGKQAAWFFFRKAAAHGPSRL